MMPPIAMQDSWLEIIARTGQCSAGEARSMAVEIIRARKEAKERQRKDSDLIEWGSGLGVPYP